MYNVFFAHVSTIDASSGGLVSYFFFICFYLSFTNALGVTDLVDGGHYV